MPPSRYLGLPWKPWGETDFWLTQGLDSLDEQFCHCGSGLLYVDCVNPANEHRIEVVTETHYGRAALERFQQDEENDPPPGTSLAVQLVPEGVDVEVRAQQQAMAEIEEMKRRHGLA